MDGQLRSFQHHLPRPGQFLTPLASSSAFFFFPSLELSKNGEADPAASWLAALCAARVYSVTVPATFSSQRLPVTMEVWGLEPQTYGLQSHRSSH